MADNKGVSRRTVLIGSTAAVATAGLSGHAAAQSKIDPAAVMYVARTDNEEQFCANCIHWEGEQVLEYSALDTDDPAMAECAIVSGNLHSTGWCGVWAPLG